MNKERVASIVMDIEKFLKDLDEMGIQTAKDLESKEKFYASSMLLFSIVNRSIDLGEEIVASRSLGFPAKYREIFCLLEKGKIIDKSLCADFSDLIHFRNLAAHEYQNFTESDVLKAMKRIKAAKKLISVIKGL